MQFECFIGIFSFNYNFFLYFRHVTKTSSQSTRSAQSYRHECRHEHWVTNNLEDFCRDFNSRNFSRDDGKNIQIKTTIVEELDNMSMKITTEAVSQAKYSQPEDISLAASADALKTDNNFATITQSLLNEERRNGVKNEPEDSKLNNGDILEKRSDKKTP